MTELIQLEIPEAVAIPPDGFVNVFYTEEDGLIVKKGKFPDGTVRTLAKEYEPLPYDPTGPFTIIAKEANTVVSLNETGEVTGTDLYYSLNGGEWKAYAFGTSVTLESDGNFVQFWNKTNSFSQSLSNYLKFRINRDVSFAGNIMSLLNFSNKCTGYCYYGMFYGCTSLTEAPELPATELADYCYGSMFRDCTFLTEAPVLPATELADYCYYGMFYGCTSLTEAPELQATELAESCYSHMFYGCTNLTTAPELHATTLAEECYGSMFSGCTSLTEAPALPATTLATRCYSSMFKDCTALTEAPELHATTLVRGCYSYMFHGCTSLSSIKVHFTDWHNYIDAPHERWVEGVSSTGTFYMPSTLPVVYGTSHIPEGWTVVNID